MEGMELDLGVRGRVWWKRSKWTRELELLWAARELVGHYSRADCYLYEGSPRSTVQVSKYPKQNKTKTKNDLQLLQLVDREEHFTDSTLKGSKCVDFYQFNPDLKAWPAKIRGPSPLASQAISCVLWEAACLSLSLLKMLCEEEVPPLLSSILLLSSPHLRILIASFTFGGLRSWLL